MKRGKDQNMDTMNAPRSVGAGVSRAESVLEDVRAGEFYGSTEDFRVTHTDEQVRAVLAFLLSLDEESGFPSRAREIAATGAVESVCQRRAFVEYDREFYWTRADFVPGSEAGKPFNLTFQTFDNIIHCPVLAVETPEDWEERALRVGTAAGATEKLKTFLVRCGFTPYDLAILDLIDGVSLEPLDNRAVCFPPEVNDAASERYQIVSEVAYWAMTDRRQGLGDHAVESVRMLYVRVTPEGTRDEVLSRMTCSLQQAHDAFGYGRRPLARKDYCQRYGVEPDDYESALLSLVPDKGYDNRKFSLAEVQYAFAAASGRRYTWPVPEVEDGKA